MNRKSRDRNAKSAVDILEEAMHLLRAEPFILTPYYIGSLPFVLGLLYFWTDMSTGANAWRHCAQAAWGLVLLFIWMKTWQSVYTARLLARLKGESPPPWDISRIVRAASIQTAIQPWSLVIVPVAFVIMLPFPQALAFFQNVTLIGSGDENNLRTVLRKSWHQASLWPMQNTIMIWLTSPLLVVLSGLVIFVVVPVSSSFNPGTSPVLLLLMTALVLIPLSPFGMVTAFNSGIAVLLGPWLLKTFLGIETIFSLSGIHIMNNTFFALVCSLTYLCLDPFLKASYSLRCFYGESLHTGEDLKVALRSLTRPGILAALLLAILLGLGPIDHVLAESQTAGLADHHRSVSTPQLDAAIERIINRPEYAWRLPREKPPEVGDRGGALQEFLESIMGVLRKGWTYVKAWLTKGWNFIKDILLRLRSSLPTMEKTESRWTSFSRIWIIIPLACIVAVMAFLAWRAWRDRKPRTPIATLETAPTLDISREDVDATALPEEGWFTLARELMEKGEHRLALRALYLATLAFLAHQDLITIAKYKSDREYELELRRRSHTRPHLAGVFAENRVLFERAWYGLYEVTPAIMEQFSLNQERMRANE